ncbi:MAG: hypothetical protein RMM29_07635 [Planctomycetota bacterium]|nr:hypothetical protein [Planctomycetota bacterium]MCX8039917.1 hypothetical protein [Planctomycetota bacterium]MDW8373499.1 hypothetical protein [Planctomycetota bacterium]
MASFLLFPLLGLLAWTLGVWWRQRRRLARARAKGSCQLCGTPFREAQIEYRGALTRAERARLDRFQARFAAWTIVCLECGAINVCTREGSAFRAFVPRDA